MSNRYRVLAERVGFGQDGPGQREAAQQVHARELHEHPSQRPVPPPSVARDQRQRAQEQQQPQAVDDPRAPAARRRRLDPLPALTRALLLLWPPCRSRGGR